MSKGKGKVPRRKYDAEFKRDAVKLSESAGYTLERAAGSLGITPSLLWKWREAAKSEGGDAFRGNGNRTTDAERIRQLEKEVRELRMERDILKKASAYFATNQR